MGIKTWEWEQITAYCNYTVSRKKWDQ